jgi:hypothetical protein
MRLSSNIGFSYTKPYDNLDTNHILFAPALSTYFLYEFLPLGATEDSTPHDGI